MLADAAHPLTGFQSVEDRYHGALASNHRWCGLDTPAKRSKGAMRPVDSDVVSSIQRHAAMTWAQDDSSEYSISTLKSAAAAADLSESSLVLRTRTSSIEFWPIFARRKRKPLPGLFWCRQPGRHLPRCLFSPGRIFISRDATENPMVRTAAGSRSGMDKYELHGHLSELLFRAAGGHVANFSSLVSRISQKI